MTAWPRSVPAHPPRRPRSPTFPVPARQPAHLRLRVPRPDRGQLRRHRLGHALPRQRLVSRWHGRQVPLSGSSFVNRRLRRRRRCVRSRCRRRRCGGQPRGHDAQDAGRDYRPGRSVGRLRRRRTRGARQRTANTEFRGVALAPTAVTGPSVYVRTPVSGAATAVGTSVKVSAYVDSPDGVGSVKAKLGSGASVNATKGAGNVWTATVPTTGLAIGAARRSR